MCHIKVVFKQPGKSTEIVHPRGSRRSVTLVTQKYHNPANKPPSLFCLMLACRKGGGGVFAVILPYIFIKLILHTPIDVIVHADHF